MRILFAFIGFALWMAWWIFVLFIIVHFVHKFW